MQLKEMAGLLALSRIIGNTEATITGVETDSRKVKPGDLFICLPGYAQDGHQFAQHAAERGAAALVVEKVLDLHLPQLLVKDSRYAMAVLACHYFRYPGSEMKLIGITGTNGKTTTAHLLEHILQDSGYITGLMGTVGMKIGMEYYETKNTTQEALELQRNFRKMRDLQTDYCVMEVSSHALEMGRVKGCDFRTAIFTNLTQDHFDYHHTMEQYKAAKGLLFSRMGNGFHAEPGMMRYAVLNEDDSASADYAKLTSAQVVTYGIDQSADVKADDIRMTASGTYFILNSFAGKMSFHLQLLGKFNIYNALGAIAAALLEGVPLSQIHSSLESIKRVEGRMEAVDEGQDFTVLVDYAHTPDSLENALTTIRQFAERKVICVFGCGGERDRTKRPIMGEIAVKYSDFALVTSDNPRSEDPGIIVQEIEQGIISAGYGGERYELVLDRLMAIKKAIELACPKDVILIAGKGHETYQLIGSRSYPFDDRLAAKEAIRGLIH